MLARPPADPLNSRLAPDNPAPGDDNTKHYWKAAGAVLAGTGNREHASAIMDLAKPRDSSSGQPALSLPNGPAQSSAPLNSAPGNLNAPREWLGLHAGDFSIPSTLPQRESWGTGMRGNPAGAIPLNGAPAAPFNSLLAPASPAPGVGGPGVLDAPDTGLRSIILKQAAGQPLNDREFRRLATRQGVENQQPAMSPSNGIEALMGRTARPLLDSSRPADTAVDRLLRQSQVQGQNEDRAAQAELRRNNLVRDNAKDKATADQQAKYTAAVKGGAKTRQELAAAGITDPKLLDSYPLEKGGPIELEFQTDPVTGQRYYRQSDRSLAPAVDPNGRGFQARDVTIGTRTLREVSPGKFADPATGKPVPWTNDVPKPVPQDAFYASETLSKKYKGDYAAYYVDAWNQSHAIQQKLDAQLEKPAEAQPSGAAPQYKSADEVKAAVQGGKLDRAAGLKILQTQFNFK
jgi:hypothetical protein